MEPLKSWPAAWLPGAHLAGRERLEFGTDRQVVARRRWHVRMEHFSGVKTEQRVREVGIQINPGGEGGRVTNCIWSIL